MGVLYIIDASAYIHRAYHAIRPLTTSTGVPTNAVYGFIKLINKIKNEKKPDYIAICFDHPSKNFRHTLLPEYKANRKEIETDLIKQMPIAREAVDAMHLCLLEKSGYEADDIIGTVAKKAEKENIKAVIVTGDKDLFQLVNENISIWNESKNIMFDTEKVYEKYEIYPNQIVDMLALMGDACDNITGIKGIGEKTAVKLIQTYGNVENIIANASSLKGKLSEIVKNGAESAVLSKQLVQLDLNVPLGCSIEDMKFNDNLFCNATDFLKKYELNSFICKTSNVFVKQDIKPDIGFVQCKAENTEIATIINNNVKIINNIASAKELQSKLLFRQEIIINLETTGYDIIKDFIVGISFCFGDNDNYYLPINHNDFTVQQISQEDFVTIFKSIFESDKIKFIGYDLKFIKHMLKKININLSNIYFDVMMASYCIDPSSEHTVQYLSNKLLNYNIDNIDNVLGKGSKKVQLDSLNLDVLSKYSCSKTIAIYKLKNILLNKFKDNNLIDLFFNIEMPIVSILFEMETIGIRIDENFVKEFDKKITEEISVLENKIFELAQESFNINSPKQLAVILFEKLKIPAIKKTKTGYSTDESVLLELTEYDIAKEILKYRELQKLKTTYIDSMNRYVQYEGKRIHTIFNQAVTTTGRLSSSEPNLQNIPNRTDYGRQLRKAFIADEGKVFISADYSQIDLRVLAHISGDKILIDAFNSGKDIHTATAMEVFNITDKEDVTKEMRISAKSINFGIVYGISPFGLSKQLSITVGQAKEYINKYLTRYIGVKNWTNEIIEEAKRNGYVKTLTGRTRYIPEVNSTNKQVVSFGERMALNTPIQGTSADIIKIAMINVSKSIKEQGLKSNILLQVHDDLLLEVPKEEENIVIKMLQYEMENAMKLKVPLLVDIKIGKNWADMVG
ncbi:MAG: DNA polymerase I [Endomicrobiaceae bacterium]|nr:DNA polymerase I [Endomicrobiaceae bacterium]MDD3052828.1 DNA polymerase I [Endomicrobiaceae bacterium]MDD3921960.1 DNA polymerase I [Endomicrobiaceae bacterium]